MQQFLISVYDRPDSRSRPAAEMAPIVKAVGALNEKMNAAGVMVFAGGLTEQQAATVVDARSGKPIVTDGPFLETKEYLGGFWILELESHDAALDWAKQAAVACTHPVEVRAFMSEPPQGT